jgi:hypothetical protein
MDAGSTLTSRFWNYLRANYQMLIFGLDTGQFEPCNVVSMDETGPVMRMCPLSVVSFRLSIPDAR